MHIVRLFCFFQIGNCGSPSASRIAGGEDARPAEFPFMTFVKTTLNDTNMTVLECGGALVGSKHVITAAHCVDAEAYAPNATIESIHVVVGALHLRNSYEAGRQEIAVSSWEKHPDYEATNGAYIHDIAVLNLTSPVVRTVTVGPVAISKVPMNDIPKPGGNCTVMGWGLNEPKPNGSYPEVLQKANVTVLPYEECDELTMTGRPYFDNGMLCASSKLNVSRGTCDGDNGGPLVCPDEKEGKLLTAILSAGQEPCDANATVQTYTRLGDTSNLQFVLKHATSIPHKKTTNFAPPTITVTFFQNNSILLIVISAFTLAKTG